MGSGPFQQLEQGLTPIFLPLHDSNPVRHIRFPYVNYGLIGLTSLVFIVQTILPARLNDDLAINFGLIPVVVRDVFPQPLPWLPDQVPLVTYAFLHADWLHLLSNMLFLFIFGDNVEDALGHVKYLLFYLVSAALAALAHTLIFPDSMGPLIGASGAVAGVLGAWVAVYVTVSFLLAQRCRRYARDYAAARSVVSGKIVDSVSDLVAALKNEAKVL